MQAAGAMVREIQELRRLLRGDPGQSLLTTIGFLLGATELRQELMASSGRYLAVVRENHEDGGVGYAIHVQDKAKDPITERFAAIIKNREITYVNYVRGGWEADLEAWFNVERSNRSSKLLLTAGDATGV